MLLLERLHYIWPLITTLLLVLLLIGLIRLWLKSQGWTLPVQEATMEVLKNDVTELKHRQDSVEHSARVAHAALDYTTRSFTNEFKRINDKLDELLIMKENIRTLEDRVDAQEQEIAVVNANLEHLKSRVDSLEEVTGKDRA